MEEKKQEVKINDRREMLKKVRNAAVFVVPTVLTFNVKDLHAQASSEPGVPNW